MFFPLFHLGPAQPSPLPSPYEQIYFHVPTHCLLCQNSYSKMIYDVSNVCLLAIDSYSIRFCQKNSYTLSWAFQRWTCMGYGGHQQGVKGRPDLHNKMAWETSHLGIRIIHLPPHLFYIFICAFRSRKKLHLKAKQKNFSYKYKVKV